MRRLIMLALSSAIVLTIPSVSTTVSGAVPKCEGFAATKIGTDRSQVIRGTDHRDVILAKGGADRIFTGDGNDVICAGPGNDVIDAGRGKDRIYGSGGNDTLRGGPGRDVLDGGNGRDGCYPAAGDDRLVHCEEADLEVTITSPTSVDDGKPIDFTVRVTNKGSTRSAPYDLVLALTQTAVLCLDDLSGTTSFQAIWPGAYAETDHTITDGCKTQPGSDWNITIRATVEMTDPDPDATNDEATARIDIKLPLVITDPVIPDPVVTPAP